MEEVESPFLVTGAGGFIGYHVAKRLLENGHRVVGVDSLTPYYDVRLKERRIDQLRKLEGFAFKKIDIVDREKTAALFASHGFWYVIHLAAQAGVRHSLVDPYTYVDANLHGFVNVLEGCRHNGCRHLLYASSSAVYGSNTKLPFSVHDNVDHPLSLYGATKKANELMAHSYSHLFALPTTGLRFFNVYGPWGRPDMAMWRFAEAIIKDQPIHLFNYGNMRRDFTYIDDVTEAVVRLAFRPAASNPQRTNGMPDPGSSSAPWRIYNIGNSSPVEVQRVVAILEQSFGRTVQKQLCPIQPGEVSATYADIEDITRDIGFRPSTQIEEGIARFVAWFHEYHTL
jgi:UDP-glucuronate 4-epimerase